MSFNRWVYVNGNPVNSTDPSGQYPICDDGKCAYQRPDWWVNQTQIYVEGLGYFDTGHLKRGWRTAAWFVREIEAALNLAVEVNTMRFRSYGGMLPLGRAWSGDDYWVDYAVSPNVRDDQIDGVAYGMFIDFELGYEEYQNSHLIRQFSGFAPADLPSDHFGFWAYMNGYEHDQIPTMLQCLGKVEVLFPQLLGIVFDSYGIPENHEFLPMIGQVDLIPGFRPIYTTRNIAWPEFLEIQSIPSSPNTWQVLNRSFP